MQFRDGLSNADIKKIKEVAVSLLAKVKEIISRLDHWTDKQETRAVMDVLIRDTFDFDHLRNQSVKLPAGLSINLPQIIVQSAGGEKIGIYNAPVFRSQRRKANVRIKNAWRVLMSASLKTGQTAARELPEQEPVLLICRKLESIRSCSR